MADGKGNNNDWTHTEQQKAARNNLMGLMGDVDDVKEKMHENMEKVLERGHKLEELADRAQHLDAEAMKLAARVKDT